MLDKSKLTPEFRARLSSLSLDHITYLAASAPIDPDLTPEERELYEWYAWELYRRFGERCGFEFDWAGYTEQHESEENLDDEDD